MITNLGDFPTGNTIYIPFHTFSSDDPSASMTITDLAVTDIEIYKDGGTTQRSSDSGYTLLDTDGIDFDGITGVHGISIDTSDNADAGFYAAGSDYWVILSSFTLDGAAISAVVAVFSIDNRGNATAVNLATVDSNVDSILADTNELQSDDIPASLNAIAGYIDTEVSAIKAVTDVIPDSGAMTSIAQEATLAMVDGIVDAILEDTAAIPSAAAIADAVLDEALADHNVGGSAGKALRQTKEAVVSVESAVNDVAATTTSFITDLTETTDDHYNNVSLVFTSGDLTGQSRPISGYEGSTKTITLEEALTEAPGDDDGFIIRTDHIHLVSEIAASVLALMRTDTITDLTNGVPPTTPTIEEAIMYLYSALIHKVDVDSGFKEFSNGSDTVIWKKALTDDGLNYVEAESEAGS